MDHSDGIFHEPQFSGPPEIEYPLPEDRTHYIVRQKMFVLPSYYEGPPLDSRHPTYTETFCVEDTNPTNQGRLLEVERIWSTVPKTQSIWESATVTYPPIGSATSSSAYKLYQYPDRVEQEYSDIIPRTSSLSLDVPVRRHVEYFIPGVVGGYSAIDEVRFIPAFRINSSTGVEQDNFEAGSSEISAATYKGWVINGVEIVVTGTTVLRYRGNIWRAETVYAKAR